MVIIRHQKITIINYRRPSKKDVNRTMEDLRKIANEIDEGLGL